jgi:hypothetical protein
VDSVSPHEIKNNLAHLRMSDSGKDDDDDDEKMNVDEEPYY